MWAGIRMWSIRVLGMSRVPGAPIEAMVRSFAFFEYLRRKNWLGYEVTSSMRDQKSGGDT